MSAPGSSPEFLSYFQRELDYLREAGKSFAKKHPKTAGQLALDEGVPQDPHVERLIESFAFLTAQLHQKVEDQFPKAASSLLHVLYPQFTQPLPSVGVMQFQCDAARYGMQDAYTIPRRTELFSYDDDQNIKPRKRIRVGVIKISRCGRHGGLQIYAGIFGDDLR